jgi:FMN phosphatase YigB (HAD superfamily)
MQKNIDETFIQSLKKKKIKVISFDIFETLAFRDVADPKEIFKKVGKKQYVKEIFSDANIFKLARIEAEKNARKKYAHLEEVTLQQIYEQLPLESKQRNKILDLEIKQEYKSLYINPQIKRWIDLAIKYKKQIIFISDMYLSTSQIEHLVMSKLDSYAEISKLFVSNEHQATKATGKLFQVVLDSLKISNDEIFHIGDNFHIDIEMAKSKNIATLFYNHDKYVTDILKIESQYALRSFHKGFHQRKLATISNGYTQDKERFFFNLGASVFGPVLWEFSHWLIDIAKQQKVTQINCIMREGRIFKKFIEKLDNDLDINLVYASRKSTFLPSIDTANNSFDVHHYRKLTIKDFYELFRLNITDTFIDSHKTVLFSEASDYVLDGKNLMQIVIEEFKDKKEQIDSTILEAKEHFLSYLEDLNYHDNSISLDFGGSGTVLKNIQNILPLKKRHKINALFYIHDSGVKKLSDSHFISFLSPNDFNTREIELIRRSHELIESLFNGEVGTTLDYQSINGSIVPVLDKADTSIKSISEAFNKGIESFFRVSKETKLKANSFSKKDILAILARLIDLPVKDEAAYLGDLYQNESFKDENIKTIICKENLDFINEIGIQEAYYSFSKEFSFQVGKISWMQGAITRLDSSFIQNIKGIKSKSVNANAIEKIFDLLNTDNIYIYGAGQFAKELLPEISQKGIDIKGFMDNRAKLGEFDFENYRVKTIDDYTLLDNDTIVIASTVFVDEIVKVIQKYSSTHQIKINIISQTS